ncbi:MAG: hypothetical protein MUE55_04885 [Thermoplasmata archaeon]|jgi:hypothetical protein|nr:hypothetical protein [Thermoplasmata archaeon]
MAPIDEITSLTSKDRILLYLSDFNRMEERYELPPELIQESIAFGTGVQRKHLSQYLDDLIKDGLLVERKAHIKGMKQRMNGYYLSSAGCEKAKVIRDHLGQIVVAVEANGGHRDMKVCEIDTATSVHLTLCDIVREAVQKGKISLASLEDVETRKREALEAKEKASDTYKRALTTAWKDGRVTATERFLLDELRKHLRITDDQHRSLENQILSSIALDHMEFIRIYRSVMEVALSDGVLEGPEVEILCNLRRVFRISNDEHADLFKEVQFEICGPSSSSAAMMSRDDKIC